MTSRWTLPILAGAAVSLLVVGCARRDTGEKPAPMPSPTAQSKPSAPKAEPVEQLQEAKAKTLIQAAMRGNVDDVKIHLRRDPESLNRPDDSGMLPIHRAADQGHSEVIRVLLRAGADVNTPHAK